MNGISGRIKIEPVAAGAKTGTAELYIPAKIYGDTLETSASLNKDFREQHSEILTVNVVTLDNYVQQMSLQQVSVLRIDVEGAEHMVLGGAVDILRTHRPFVFLEILSPSAADLLEPFRAAADYQAMGMRNGAFMKLEKALCIPDAPNQFWYPKERENEVILMSDDLNMEFSK